MILKASFEELMKRFPPELVKDLKKTQQNPKWHPEGNAYNHTKIVFDKLKDQDLKIAALFHDLGKIDTVKKNEEGEWTSPGHDKYAIDYIKQYKQLFPEVKNWEKINVVCANHMRAHYYVNGELGKVKSEVFERTPYFDDIMTFEKADGYNGK